MANIRKLKKQIANSSKSIIESCMIISNLDLQLEEKANDIIIKEYELFSSAIVNLNQIKRAKDVKAKLNNLKADYIAQHTKQRTVLEELINNI